MRGRNPRLREKVSLSGPAVFSTVYDDGSADFTIAVDDENHKFSAAANGSHAIIEYEETLSWRGVPRVKEPGEEVFKMVMQSEEMTEFLEANGLSGVRRKR